MILFPIKNGRISQRFGENVDFYKARFNIDGGHNGADVVSFHGDDILGPERGHIFKTYDGATGSVTKGFGLYMIGDPDSRGVCNMWSFWHTMSDLLVKAGDKVEQGQVMAHEGASGAVYVNMQPVPDSEKGKYPYRGTHLHWGRMKVLRVQYPDDGSRVLSAADGSPYRDPEGFVYQVLGANNAAAGYIDPMEANPLQWEAWMAQKELDANEAALADDTKTAEEKKKAVEEHGSKALSYMISLLAKLARWAGF